MISIIIPVFNREKYIEYTLRSVLDQNYDYWECIVVDDGSTDNSIKIIESFCKEDSRFQLVHRKQLPKGAPTCRNIGLDMANGKYVIFLDSDDLLASDCLPTRIKLMDCSKEMDFGVFRGMLFAQHMGDKNVLISSFESKDIDPILSFINLDIPWITLNPIYRIESLRINHIKWDEDLKGYQDIDFHMNCISKNLKFKIFDKSLPDCFWRVENEDKMGLSLTKLNFFESNNKFIVNLITYLKELKRFGRREKISLIKFCRPYFDNMILLKENKETFKIVDFMGENQLLTKPFCLWLKLNTIIQIYSNYSILKKLSYRLTHKLVWGKTRTNYRKKFFCTTEFEPII
ncbi:glycosyltransferase family 2 protein [Robertkochia solimangrovi]|uniref:glycosyltransferase family 2 protein n=1 Tax=Robertkochia solimangrovi TaxID=2213046 RepID=UPI00117F13EA|nr:glycosyltransferase family 2 protein [Robertkochia solimangrovi]TRZ44978.1 hypothetical protein DMZ48_04245 [Robertkochia solimangrovi]